MAKNDRWSLPPEGLWVSPTGRQEPVNEHLLAIAERPDIFGLSKQDVAGTDEKALQKIAERLIKSGWTRYRYLDGVYNFETDSASTRMKVIKNILEQAKALPEESVFIVQMFAFPKEYEGKVKDVYDGTILRFANKRRRCAWAYSFKPCHLLS